MNVRTLVRRALAVFVLVAIFNRAAANAAAITNLLCPLRKGCTLSGYGFGDSWEFGECPAGTLKRHTGLDEAAAPGDEVLAMADGVVKDSYGAGKGWASGIVIESRDAAGQPWQQGFIHVNPKVRVGDVVKRGQVVAIVAAISSPHLHVNVFNGPFDAFARRGALPDCAPPGTCCDKPNRCDPCWPYKFQKPVFGTATPTETVSPTPTTTPQRTNTSTRTTTATSTRTLTVGNSTTSTPTRTFTIAVNTATPINTATRTNTQTMAMTPTSAVSTITVTRTNTPISPPTFTSTPAPVCTAPPCANGILTCPSGSCPNGCGLSCLLFTPTYTAISVPPTFTYTPTRTPTQAFMSYVANTGSTLRVRSCPSVGCSIVGGNPDGARLDFPQGTGNTLAEGYLWYRISSAAGSGYSPIGAWINDLFPVTGETVYVMRTSGIGLNLRSSPTTTASVVCAMPEGTNIYVLNGTPTMADGYLWFRGSANCGSGYFPIGRWMSPLPPL